jgi:hypothetical protein
VGANDQATLVDRGNATLAGVDRHSVVVGLSGDPGAAYSISEVFAFDHPGLSNVRIAPPKAATGLLGMLSPPGSQDIWFGVA